MSSPKVIQKLWDGLQGDPRTVYQLLFENSWHSSIVVSLGALFGGVAMIYVVQHSRPVKAQSLFFIILGVFLIVTGATFKPFLTGGAELHWVLVIFYFLCNFFFNLGANATTFIVSLGLCFQATGFPTQNTCLIGDLNRYPPNNSQPSTVAHVTAYRRLAES